MTDSLDSFRTRIRGLYAIVDRFDRSLAEALLGPGGVRIIQLRIKEASGFALLDFARYLRALTQHHQALFVVNDRIDIALAAQADAVHLGQDDLPLSVARTIAPHLRVGISTHTEEQVRQAVSDGADYIGFGPVFATSTKRNPDPLTGTQGLAQAVALAGATPVVAIGGITPELASEVAATGAAAACAISSVNQARDVAEAASAIGRAFAQHPR